MASGDQYVFASVEETEVPTGRLTPIVLTGPSPASAHLRLAGVRIEFLTEGWYEVLLRVDWDPSAATGTRFSHTKVPGQEPLHSEAIGAGVLSQISQGRQLLRGNSLFGPDRTTGLELEVWHDAPGPVGVRYAELVVRELAVPWPVSTGASEDGGQTP